MADEQEAAFVKAFIVKEKQERYLQLLASPKRRREILDRFNHNLDFDPKYAAIVPKELRTLEDGALTPGAWRRRDVPCYRRCAGRRRSGFAASGSIGRGHCP